MRYEIYTAKTPDTPDNEYVFRGSLCYLSNAKRKAEWHFEEGRSVQIRRSTDGACVFCLMQPTETLSLDLIDLAIDMLQPK